MSVYTVLLITGLSWQILRPATHAQHQRLARDRKSANQEVVDYHPQSTAEDVVALLESLGITKNVIIMAHSLGECTGYYIATTRPDLVKASIGVDPLYAFPNAIRERDASFFTAPGAQDAALPLLLEHFGAYC
ncbi:alpha beta hydrolase fold protein [Colletotrichum incanum]|uniref:Alpha beta hydrolase fold protein n=1 Tax=Colletotrichum incanum TaxID=1573173 RepID=A0A166XIY9_COLIC|nr:alpha beta hydrolase fold protein [Colletotrichum incanum]